MKTKINHIVLLAGMLFNFFLWEAGGAVQPPGAGAGLKLWLKADTGVNTNVDGTVNGWADQAGSALDHSGLTEGGGFPTLTTASNFPAGPRPVIHFDGTAGIACSNVNDLNGNRISAYVVARVTTNNVGGEFVSNLRNVYGFGLGMSPTVPGQPQWYTGLPGNSMVPASTVFQDSIPYLVEGTFSDTTKAMYIDGTNVANATGLALGNATENGLCVGADGNWTVNSGDTNLADIQLVNFLNGDVAEVLVYTAVSTWQRLAVEAYLYSKYFSVATGNPSIAQQPQPQTVNELETVTFAVNANGQGPLAYQWLKDGVPITSTNGPILTLASVVPANAGDYRVIVSGALNPGVTSVVATLTVLIPTNKPTILAADRDFDFPTKLDVQFSETVSPATATVAANYSIDHGITISNVVMGATPDSVILTVSPITFGPAYTLTVNNVQDQFGNVIAANSQKRVTVPDPNALVPTKNLQLWLRADFGVTADVDGFISAWADQQVGNLPKNETSVGTPTLGTYNFVNGPHPVVNFDGVTTGFTLNNDLGLQLTNMSIYIVVNEAASSISKVFVGNYVNVAGWALGISDGVADQVKWFTAPPDSMEPGGASLLNPDGTPYLLTATYASAGGVKQLFVSTNVVGSKSGVQLVYAPGCQANLGQLSDGGGQRMNGSVAELLIYSGVSDSQNAVVWDYLNGKYFGLGSGPILITHQPVSQTVNEVTQPATFEVGFKGAQPVSIQWYENLRGTNTFQPIPNATNTFYTIPSVTRAQQGSLFQARLSNSVPSSAVSSNAVLTVIVDDTPPTLVSARRAYLDATRVSVAFSEAVAPATATVAANYSINNGLTVAGATIGVNASNVVLTFNAGIPSATSPTLTVSNVTDLVGNPIANGAHVMVSVPASSARPPVNSDLVLWLAADQGVSTKPDGHSATNWADLSGAAQEHSGAEIQGSPQLAVANFNTGPNPVVRFDGASGFSLDNAADFNLDQMSIYVVGSVDNGVASSEFIANWAGFAFGISDGVPGRVKWVNFDGTTVHSMEPVGASLGNHVPTQLTGTLDSNKKLYVNGTLVGSETNVTVAYSSSATVVGMLFFGGAQFLVGDIAEILVYSTVDDTQRASVDNYLYQKYFTAPPTLAIARSGSNVVLTWAGGGILQSSTNVVGTYTDIIGSSSPWTNAPMGDQKYYRVRR